MHTQSSNQRDRTLGASGDWRRRMLLHYAPLALLSGLALGLFMTLPAFDPQAYPQVDMEGGVIPQAVGQVGHGASQVGPEDHSGGDSAGSGGHGRDSSSRSEGHGGSQGPSSGRHGGEQNGATDAAGEDPEVRSRGRLFDRFFTQRLTRATGYVATGLLALTLLVGPANLLLHRQNPVSSYLRRDIGIWTAIVSVVHIVFGLQLHGGLRGLSGFLTYFVAPDGSPRLNSFGLGNWTGLAATLIVMGLLALSNDFALRKLKAGPWKWLQRLNYALFALVLLHAFFYGALLRTTSPSTILLGLAVFAVFTGQAVGIWLWQRRRLRRGSSTP